jgi:hypothetical protein
VEPRLPPRLPGPALAKVLLTLEQLFVFEFVI